MHYSVTHLTAPLGQRRVSAYAGPCLLLMVYNGHVEQWKKAAWSDESSFLLHHVDDRVRHLPGEEMAPGCIMGRRQAGGGSVMGVLVLVTPGHLQRSCGVHASTGQSCVGVIRGGGGLIKSTHRILYSVMLCVHIEPYPYIQHIFIVH